MLHVTCDSTFHRIAPFTFCSCMRARARPRFDLVQATVKIDYGPRKQVTLQFFYPSQAASCKMDSPLGVGTEV